RRILGKSLGNRFSAFATGLGLTALLQSSTATGIMTASLAANGVSKYLVSVETQTSLAVPPAARAL
ncbi:MAG: hypothetical protein WA199_06075, partial [Xanthobacteraceae bacterium]